MRWRLRLRRRKGPDGTVEPMASMGGSIILSAMVDEGDDAILDELTRVIVERFAPERVVLFGSRGRGDHRPESDYDLMIVVDRPPAPPDVIEHTVRDMLHNVDVLVDSSDKFERRRSDVGTLEYIVDREGRVLYARAGPSERRRETPKRPSESLKEWIARAENDFAVMELARAGAPDATDAVTFHAHQGVEKLLEACLVANQVAPPRTHDLMDLVTGLPNHLRVNRELGEACAGLHRLWRRARYPDEPLPTGDQARQAVDWARRARDILRVAIG
jgi:HEPN domain-containing protein/predicted nucleotidyltransferase